MPSSPTPSPALKLELPDFVKTNYLIILFPLFLFFGLIVWLAVWGKRVAEKGVHRQLQQQPAAAVAHGREPANNAIGDQAGGLRRRAAAAGTAVAAGGDDVHAEASDEEDNDIDDNEGGGGGDAGPTKAPKRIGKKKALSLQRKEDRRRHNDFLEMQRDDRLRRQELIEEEAEKRAAIELKAQQAEEAREQREKDKRARQEAKEFQVWKRQMGVDEAGHEEEIGRDGGDAKGLESSLIDYIKIHRQVVIEQVAARFNLKIPRMVEMLHEFMADDRLSGILDDRGRFIYISTSEQDRIVEMIEREGKISIADLVAGCNRIINESN